MCICTNAMNYHWLMEQLKEIEDSELNQLLYANSCWLHSRRILQKKICIVNSKLKCLPNVQQTKTTTKNSIVVKVFSPLL